MEAVRLTFHKGYRHKDGTPYSPKHDDRNGFSKSKSAENNVYENHAALTWGGETFYDSEIACYKACFGQHIKRYNAQRKKERHPEECIDIEQYYKKHPPEETLLYLGNKDNNVGSEVLLEVFHDYRAWLQSECVDDDKGCGVELLNDALHMDEATPHIQLRQIYYYTDKYGNFQISQNKALAGLGFERPDMTSKTSRKNNAKVTFTAVCREKLIEIAKSHGVELIEEPLPKEESGRSLEDYIAHEKLKEEQQALYAETESAKQAIQAERDALCVEKEKAKQELERIREDMAHEVQELGGLKAYNALKKAERDEKAKQEAEREAQKERERQEKIAAERERLKQETQGRVQAIQNTPETPDSVEVIPDTPKAQTPLKNDCRSSEAYAKLKKANSELITTEEAVALLLEP